MELKIATPDQGVLNKSAETMLSNAKAIVIDSQSMFEVAAEELQAVKKKAKELEEQRTGLVSPLNDVVKKINAMFKPPMEFLASAESIIKRAMLTYTDEQDRRRREEEARARAKAEEEAARQRAKIAQEQAAAAERARLEQVRLEEERQAALAAGNTVMAEKIAAKAEGAAEAAEAKQDGLAEAAATIQAAPVVVPLAEAPKAAGISSRGVWKGEVTDKLELVKYIAQNPQFLHLLDASQKEINSLAKALKGNCQVAGLRVWEDKTITARAA